MLERVEFAANTAVLPHPRPFSMRRPSRVEVADHLVDMYAGELQIDLIWPRRFDVNVDSPENGLATDVKFRQTNAQIAPGPRAGRVLLSLQAYAEATVNQHPKLDPKRHLGGQTFGRQ